ncbi:ferredoxin [Streptomyces sp. NPDC005811]|uniref:ferredoxin n=1 Tax=Streptomyces sp. NPDC005811 TaxID=3154565 RepID=UPI0033CA77DD
MKVRVDPERCQGHTLCFMRAPEVFELSEIDGHSTPVADEVPEDQEGAVVEAVRSCPERAIGVF